MIRINLAPPSALKNKVWFVPELTLFLSVTFMVWYSSFLFLESIRNETKSIKRETQSIKADASKLLPEVKRYKVVKAQVDEIDQKLLSLKKVTVSKVSRYTPIILLEHLQTMKPIGLWLKGVQIDSANNQIHIKGGAFDNLLIAEFIAKLESTEDQEIIRDDVRTFIYFSKIQLQKIYDQTEGIKEDSKSKKPAKTQAERESKEFQETFKKETEDIEKGSLSSEGASLFPELEKFPSFTMVLKYAERGVQKTEEAGGP